VCSDLTIDASIVRIAIRKTIRETRAQLSSEFQQHASWRIFRKLAMHPILERSQSIAGYFAARHEVDMSLWFQHAWKRNKRVYLPRMVNHTLQFAHYTQDTPLTKNQWKILEPNTQEIIMPEKLEVVILPLVAFDTHGNRLGQGAGYYDRTFSFLLDKTQKNRPYLIGLGYECQRIDCLPACPWDVPLQEVITETAHYVGLKPQGKTT
jgi:5-formyltetrahydrofolate cyclo-ligase